MANENTTEPTNWERYDLARSRLNIMIGHYSELIRGEEQNTTPDAKKIRAWEGLQDELADRDAVLSVDDLEAVELINLAYGPAASAIMKART
jgi:hypothetical protein